MKLIYIYLKLFLVLKLSLSTPLIYGRECVALKKGTKLYEAPNGKEKYIIGQRSVLYKMKRPGSGKPDKEKEKDGSFSLDTKQKVDQLVVYLLEITGTMKILKLKDG